MRMSDYNYTMSVQKNNLKPLKLKVYVEGDDSLKQEYQDHINKHNSKTLLNGHPDSGFDLLFPQEEIINEEGGEIFSHKLDLKISVALYEETKECITMHNTLGLSGLGTILFILMANYQWWMLCMVFLCMGGLMYMLDNDVYASRYREDPMPFMLLPRSSMGSKTPLRLSNSVGVIDSGYRGHIIACVDCLKKAEVVLSKYQRVFQIVAFSGRPIYVELVDNSDALGYTERGDGGFGSTGK